MPGKAIRLVLLLIAAILLLWLIVQATIK